MTSAASFSNIPLLYSFRRCPYAIRARLALALRNIQCEIVVVQLKAKPAALLELNPKGTVPVLVLPNGEVLNESLDIMRWALSQVSVGAAQFALRPECTDAQSLILANDLEFKYWLDRYKYADRYPAHDFKFYQEQVLLWFMQLESRLKETAFLCGSQPSIADLALVPFVRQAAAVDLTWFEHLACPALQQWRQDWLESAVFKTVMKKKQ